MALRRNTHDRRCTSAYHLERIEQSTGILRGKARCAEAQAPEFNRPSFEQSMGFAGRDEKNIAWLARPSSLLLHARTSTGVESYASVRMYFWCRRGMSCVHRPPPSVSREIGISNIVGRPWPGIPISDSTVPFSRHLASPHILNRTSLWASWPPSIVHPTASVGAAIFILPSRATPTVPAGPRIVILGPASIHFTNRRARSGERDRTAKPQDAADAAGGLAGAGSQSLAADGASGQAKNGALASCVR